MCECKCPKEGELVICHQCKGEGIELKRFYGEFGDPVGTTRVQCSMCLGSGQLRKIKQIAYIYKPEPKVKKSSNCTGDCCGC